MTTTATAVTAATITMGRRKRKTDRGSAVSLKTSETSFGTNRITFYNDNSSKMEVAKPWET